MKTYNCLILDDDELDRLSAVSHVKRFPQFEIKGVFGTSAPALELVAKEKIDVLFLDIDMPDMSGLEFRQFADQVPVCIFISAHPEHAVETFALDTLDFIVKPIKSERFAQSVARIEDYLDLKEKASLFESSVGGDVIYIKEGYEQKKVKLHDILYLEALKDYTKLVTRHKRHCVLSNIGTLLKEDSFSSFVRVHRSFAVQKQFVDKILPNELVLQGNFAVPLGRSYKDSIAALIK